MDQFDPLGRGINNIYISSFTYEFFCLYFLDPPYNITVPFDRGKNLQVQINFSDPWWRNGEDDLYCKIILKILYSLRLIASTFDNILVN